MGTEGQAVRFRDCTCPGTPHDGRDGADDGDIVYLRPVLGFAAGAEALRMMGASDGDTTDFEGGWQAGVLVSQVWAGRPDSQVSLGVHQGWLSDKGRANLADAGDDPAHYEEGLELTYADRIGRFTLQPDVQLIRYAGGLRDADTVVVVALRVTTALY
jgi:porin